VIGGIEVVDKIAGVKTAATAVSEGQPLSNVVIKSAVVLQ
jgi:hypothetical protein